MSPQITDNVVRRLGALAIALLMVLAACTVAPEATPTRMPTEPVEEETTDTSEPPPSPTPAEAATSTPSPTAEPEETPEPEPTEVTETPFEPVVGLEPVADGLAAPVDLVSAQDGSGRLFVVEQIGRIRIVTADGELLEEPFLDMSDRLVALSSGYDERGLLGLAFHPDYGENGRFYVYYSAPLSPEAPAGYDHTSHLSSFTVSETDENVADADSEQVILRVDQPQGNHNGGEIAFGPDGYLYVALGDGGGANDVGAGHVEDWYEANEGGNGQDITENLLGSMLRLDVDGPEPYSVPDDNPFSDDGDEGLGEVWAYGFRNPYRFSFDAGGDRDLFVADVGQNLWEEVNIVTAGGNYGWNVKEGTHCFSTATPNESPETCPDSEPDGSPLIDPIIEYRNAGAGGLGIAVVGGHVYRGEALPAFEGRYVFGDWSTSFSTPDGTLLVATRPESEGEMWPFEELQIATRDDGELGAFLLGFGEDAQGELYVLTSQASGPQPGTGRVWRIVPPE